MEDSKIREIIKKLHIPSAGSHKGQNGKLLIIGGSHLFHAASLWALEVASRIVDLVHYSSIKENNEIVHDLRKEWRGGIVIPRAEIENYINEDDCILIGPGMVRTSPKEQIGKYQISSIRDIEKIKDEGEQTYFLTKYLLQKYPYKKWVIDAGALQMMEPEQIAEKAILTPHRKEFERIVSKISKKFSVPAEQKNQIKYIAEKYKCIILLKGKEDIIASGDKIEAVAGGNAGMTKGGTGDVLAGLLAALYCKNEAFVAAVAASYINKQAGEDLYKKTGLWFNASDLADQIPLTMKRLLLK